MQTLEAIASGVVQGVGYRYFVQRQGTGLGLVGYAMNLPDGTVKVVAQGPREKLDTLLEDLKRGPAMSSVTGVSASWSASQPQFTEFGIRF